jgi:phage FluMu protein Com
VKEAKCPACKKVIQLVEETEVEELIVCPHCKSILEYVNQFPPILDWAEDPEVCSYRRIFNKMY